MFQSIIFDSNSHFHWRKAKGRRQAIYHNARKACCTGLVYSKESHNLFVVDSQEDRGIYIIDTALGNEEPTYAKQVSNNSDLQQSIQLNSS